MPRHALAALVAPIVVAVVSASLLGGCSSDSSSKSGSPTVPVASDSPATPTSPPGGGTVDCAAAKDALGSFIVNTQILAQLPGQSDVTQWPTTLGTMAEFGTQLDTLATAVAGDADATASIAFFQGANKIAQRGYAGDATAPAELATYLGPDLTAVLLKQAPVGIALDKTGC